MSHCRRPTNLPLAGAIIVAWDINNASLSKTKKLVEQTGAKCYTYNVDVTDRHKVYETARIIREDIGLNNGIYMLINNAGIVIGEHRSSMIEHQASNCFRRGSMVFE